MTNKITEMEKRSVVSNSYEEVGGKVGMNRIRYTVVREMFCILTLSMWYCSAVLQETKGWGSNELKVALASLYYFFKSRVNLQLFQNKKFNLKMKEGKTNLIRTISFDIQQHWILLNTQTLFYNFLVWNNKTCPLLSQLQPFYKASCLTSKNLTHLPRCQNRKFQCQYHHCQKLYYVSWYGYFAG